MVLAAEVACEVLSVNVLKELQVAKQEFFAEVTVRVGEDVSKSFVTHVTIFDVIPDLIEVVEPLLPHEHRPAL